MNPCRVIAVLLIVQLRQVSWLGLVIEFLGSHGGFDDEGIGVVIVIGVVVDVGVSCRLHGGVISC